ncbi:MAG: hypothetical protein KKE50_07240 [Nanoarchaeota archaeon]|nr:hypothetical protein [Nanoarchaeota archaeon]
MPQTVLELSVKEMGNLARGKPDKDGGRTPVCESVDASFRNIPMPVISTARRLLSDNNPERALRYIENAFYIYRESVCMGWFAPHYKAEDNVFEWPTPSKFSWASIDAVILGGEHVHGPIPNLVTLVTISRREGDKVEERRVNPETGEETTSIRELIPGRDNLQETLKYKIGDIHNIGFLNSQDWQNYSLQNYANPTYWHLVHLLDGSLSPEQAKKHLEKGLEILSSPVQTSIRVIKRSVPQMPLKGFLKKLFS